MKKIFLSLILAFTFVLTGCDDHDNDSKPQTSNSLVELKNNGSISKSILQQLIVASKIDAQFAANYDVSLYSIKYKTTYMGEPITSKGLLIVPNGVKNVQLLMYCHQTFLPLPLSAEPAPSDFNTQTQKGNDETPMYLGWAAAGYMVFVPDYIGYGSTALKEHPYAYYPEMFKSNFDGLLAVKQYIHEQKLNYDNSLFLTGFSEGAGAAVSAHKYIQEKYSSEFTVKASSSYAGPYNCVGSLEHIWANPATSLVQFPFDPTDFSNYKLNVNSWALYSINKFSGLKRPTDQLYVYSVTNQLGSLDVKSYIPNQVFKTDFMEHLKDGSDTAFYNTLKENSYDKNWKPVGKVFLHHGDSDKLVPYFHSRDAYTGLTAAGGNVKLYTYQGGTHGSDFSKYFENTLKDFNALK